MKPAARAGPQSSSPRTSLCIIVRKQMAAALASSQPANRQTSTADTFDLLCACAAQVINTQASLDSPPPTHAGFDWNSFIHLAQHHGLLALVAGDVLARPEVPAKIKQSVHSFYTTNVKRSLWLTTELAAIFEHFAKKNVPAIPYKGPVLALSAYGNLALRTFHDLDLLIPAAQFAPAKNALAEIGFHPSQALSPAVERFYLRTGYERSFDGAAGRNMVELQWDFLPRFYAVDCSAAGMSVDALLPRAGRISLGAAEVPCLAPEDSLLALCLHGAKHLWARLIWVADISATLGSQQIDWGVVAQRARALGIGRIVAVSLRLAEQLLHAQLPDAARQLITRDPEEFLLANEFAERLRRSASYDFDSTDYFLKIRRLREHPSDRRRYLWRLVWTPGPGEIAAVQLPEPLFPLYRAVRIGRLIAKLF